VLLPKAAERPKLGARRLHRRAVHLGTQQAADEERLIANRLGRQTHARTTGEEAIEGIVQFRISDFGFRIERRSDLRILDLRIWELRR